LRLSPFRQNTRAFLNALEERLNAHYRRPRFDHLLQFIATFLDGPSNLSLIILNNPLCVLGLLLLSPQLGSAACLCDLLPQHLNRALN